MKKSYLIIIAHFAILCCILFVVGLILPRCVGGWKDADYARANIYHYYEESQLIYTAETENKIVDFLVDGDRFSVVSFNRKESVLGVRYSTTYSARTRIDFANVALEDTADFNELGKVNWNEVRNISLFSKKDPLMLEWIILDSQCRLSGEGIIATEFTYGDLNLCLYVKESISG